MMGLGLRLCLWRVEVRWIGFFVFEIAVQEVYSFASEFKSKGLANPSWIVYRVS